MVYYCMYDSPVDRPVKTLIFFQWFNMVLNNLKFSQVIHLCVMIIKLYTCPSLQKCSALMTYSTTLLWSTICVADMALDGKSNNQIWILHRFRFNRYHCEFLSFHPDTWQSFSVVFKSNLLSAMKLKLL